MTSYFLGRPDDDAGHPLYRQSSVHTIFLHGMVRDEHGQKMSKTKENVIDPVDITQEYGADALRLGLLLMAAPGRDIKLSIKRIEGIRASDQVWNATRFAQTYLKDCTPSDWDAPAGATEAWIRSRLAATQETVSEAFDAYRLDEAGHAIYHFIWHQALRLVHRAGEAPTAGRRGERAGGGSGCIGGRTQRRFTALAPLLPSSPKRYGLRCPSSCARPSR